MLKANNSGVLPLNTPALSSSLNKEVSYFGFLANRSSSFSFLMDERANWVSAPLSFSSTTNRYSSIFYKGFYNLLNANSTSLTPIHFTN